MPGSASSAACKPEVAVFAESFWPLAATEWSGLAARNVVIADALFAGLSALGLPRAWASYWSLRRRRHLQPGQATVILDRVQDAGNVGAILRSAAAFGFRQVAAHQGTAGLWSPKVLRAGMGAHFGLRLVEGLEPAQLEALAVPVIVTSSHHGELLHKQKLPWPCAWALGHEGQGVSPEIARRAALSVRIAQPGGEESLNVASAAAICLHASAAAAGRLRPCVGYNQGLSRKPPVRLAHPAISLTKAAIESPLLSAFGRTVTIRRTQCFCLYREPSRPPSWRSQTARSFTAIRSAPPAPPPAKSCSTRRMTGYQEILTDPSYCRQIVTLTYPHIGNYGVNAEDVEADARSMPRAWSSSDLPLIASNFRSEPDAVATTCSARSTVAIAGIDTRKLTRMLREQGRAERLHRRPAPPASKSRRR